MRSPDSDVRRALVALTVAFALGGAAFALGAPLFQAPDEPPHVDLVRHYARHPFDLAGPELRVRSGVKQAVDAVGLPQGGPLPWPAETRARPAYPAFDGYPDGQADAVGCRFGPFETCQNYHFAHPPTFYWLMAIPDRLLDDRPFPTEMAVLRLLCVLLVTPMVPLTFYAARQVWPGAVRRPLAAAALVATFPPLAALAGAVNNDSLLLVLAAATIAVTARLLRRPRPATALAVGLAVGAGLLVKIEFVALAVPAGVAVAVAAAGRPRSEWRDYALRAAAPVVAGSAWWIRNLVRFRRIEPEGGEILQPVRPGPWNDATLTGYALDHADDLLGRFWGLYGQTAVETPAGWRTGLAVAAAGLAAAWLLTRTWRRPRVAELRMAVLALFPLVLAGGAVNASFRVFHRNGEVRGLLGRYLYSALPVLAIAAAAAMAAVAIAVARRRRLWPGRLLAVGIVGAAALGLAGFTRAMHGFYGTRSLGLLLERAGTVTPVAGIGRWWALLGAAWAAAVAVAAVSASRLDAAVAARGQDPVVVRR